MSIKDPRAYTGIAVRHPGEQYVVNRKPTQNDVIPYDIGDRWIVPTNNTMGQPSNEVWVLMAKPENVANWVQINEGSVPTYLNHRILIGSGTDIVNQIPTGTSGQILVSGGASADASWVNAGTASSISISGDTGGALTGNAFTFTGGTTGLSFGGSGTTETVSGTLVVSNGGTGQSSFTANAPIIAGSSSTAALAQVTTNLNTNGYVLTANSVGAPTFQALPGSSGGVIYNSFTSPGSSTFTLNASTVSVNVVCIGGGGGGSCGFTPGYAASGGGGGGGAGQYTQIYAPVAFFGGSGASVSYTVGAAGTGKTAAVISDGTNGGNTTFGQVFAAGGTLGNANPSLGQVAQLAISNAGNLGAATLSSTGASGAGANANGGISVATAGINGIGISLPTGGGGGGFSNSTYVAGANGGTIYQGDGSTVIAAGGTGSGVNASGGNGTAAGSTTKSFLSGGTGGGGGGGTAAGSGTAGNGGNGAIPGGGGGGGGGGSNTLGNNGNGGLGAPGAIYVVEYLG